MKRLLPKICTMLILMISIFANVTFADELTQEDIDTVMELLKFTNGYGYNINYGYTNTDACATVVIDKNIITKLNEKDINLVVYEDEERNYVLGIQKGEDGDVVSLPLYSSDLAEEVSMMPLMATYSNSSMSNAKNYFANYEGKKIVLDAENEYAFMIEDTYTLAENLKKVGGTGEKQTTTSVNVATPDIINEWKYSNPAGDGATEVKIDSTNVDELCVQNPDGTYSYYFKVSADRYLES